MSVFIHPSVSIGKNTYIHPLAYIEKNVEIGENSWIGPHVAIFSGTPIGNEIKIFPGAVIGADPQDFKYDGKETKVYIGDGTSIREHATIHRATTHHTIVGKNTMIMAYAHVAHDAQIGDNCVLANQVSVAGHVKIENDVVLEGMSAIQQFIHIGEHAFIAGGSLVRKNIPPYIKTAREPLVFMGINTVGMKRKGMHTQDIQHITDIYRLIFIHNTNIKNGINQIKKQYPDSPFAKKIITFIENSPKGIVKKSVK